MKGEDCECVGFGFDVRKGWFFLKKKGKKENIETIAIASWNDIELIFEDQESFKW